MDMMVELTVNGHQVTVEDRGWTLLDVLRHELGLRSVKDGCAPQGQCGCCTVLVDGKPRVACVTPARRVRGRSIVTLEGLDTDAAAAWGEALCATGGSQCGFCTPGIIMRLQPLVGEGETSTADLDQALLAHLCRCTGWQTVKEAAHLVGGREPDPTGQRGIGETEVILAARDTTIEPGARDLAAASRRASLEGRAAQIVSPAIALGSGGFAADTVPDDHLVAVLASDGQWVVAESAPEARAKAGKVQGRRTTATHQHPIDLPEGPWQATLRTTWVDGAYLETDAAWCRPGEEPTNDPAANGGAFGAKPITLDLGRVARQLADEHDRTVLVLASREDVARHSPKRPPLAAGIRADGTGLIRVAATDGITEAIRSVAPNLDVEQVEIQGPPTSSQVRGAGWVEAMVLTSAVSGSISQVEVNRCSDGRVVAEFGRAKKETDIATGETVSATVTSPDGATATARITAAADEAKPARIAVVVEAGEILDPIVLRSYSIGAAHMAWSWLISEAMLVDDDGTVHDLTVRSFGVLRALDTPAIEVEIVEPNDPVSPPVNGSDAVFAAVAVAGWHLLGRPTDWPCGFAAHGLAPSA